MGAFWENRKKVLENGHFQKNYINDNFNIFNCLKMPDLGVNYVIDIKMNQPYQLQ